MSALRWKKVAAWDLSRNQQVVWLADGLDVQYKVTRAGTADKPSWSPCTRGNQTEPKKAASVAIACATSSPTLYQWRTVPLRCRERPRSRRADVAQYYRYQSTTNDRNRHMSDDVIRLAKHWERGGTVENPKWLLRELIAEAERLRELVRAVRDELTNITDDHVYDRLAAAAGLT